MDAPSALAGLETLKEVLGGWLDARLHEIAASRASDDTGGRRRHRRFHPLAEAFDRAFRGRFDAIPTLNYDLVRLGRVGLHVRALRDLRADGLSEKVRDLASDNWQLFRSTTFELEVAHLHALTGRSIQFVPTKDGTRTPDLLYDGAIEVECKSQEPLSERDRSAIEMWEQFQHAFWRELQRAPSREFGYYVALSTDVGPTRDDIDWAIPRIRQAVGTGRASHHSETGRALHVGPCSVEITTISSGTKIEPVPPADARPLTEYDRKKIEIAFVAKDGVVQPSTPVAHMLGMRVVAGPDWIQSASHALASARSQFSGDRPAIIFLEAPPQQTSAATRSKERLKEAIYGFFARSARVGAVVAVFEEEVEDDDNAQGVIPGGLIRSYEYEHNPRARHLLPEAGEYFSKV